MKNKIYLQNQINQRLADLGEKPEWKRSINPAGDILCTKANGVRLLILDSAIEDNNVQKILEVATPFLLANMHNSKQWILDSSLNLRAE